MNVWVDMCAILKRGDVAGYLTLTLTPLRVAFVHVERTFLAFQKKIGCLSAVSGSLGRGTPRPCGAVFGKLGLGWRMEGREGF